MNATEWKENLLTRLGKYPAIAISRQEAHELAELLTTPVLGEAVLVSSLSPGDAAWVQVDGRLWPGVKGYTMVTGSYQAPGTDFRKFERTGDEFVYRCPRPDLPCEQTLREKIRLTLSKHDVNAGEASQMVSDLAALLKGAE
jgi:hypothetical protein